MDKIIHIVCHDIPFPVSHGGYFDLYYKLRWLHGQGFQIHLHCFHSNRQPTPVLDSFCKEVFYYSRNVALPLTTPYIVGSRKDERLLKNLQRVEAPILFEGIHTTHFALDSSLKDRARVVRLCNHETIYYQHLAQYESSWFKRIYFKQEAKLLNNYENKIAQALPLLALSQIDVDSYKEFYQAPQIELMPVFLPYEEVKSPLGKGKYCLYHGNLSINENTAAVRKLVEQFFKNADIPFVVAGREPDDSFKKWISRYPHVKCVYNPDDQQLSELIRDAHIHILPSENNTGIKLKILHALFEGRHCVTNEAAVKGMPEQSLCHLITDANSLKSTITSLMETAFTAEMLEERKKVLLSTYDKDKNGQILIRHLFPHYPKRDHLPS